MDEELYELYQHFFLRNIVLPTRLAVQAFERRSDFMFSEGKYSTEKKVR